MIAKIKSSTSIVHLSGVILELIKNALDANANTVFVTVDFKRGGCIVEDNGDGIPPIEFETTGGLGKPHRMNTRSNALLHWLTFMTDTSKFKQSDSYGHNGLFLASLASLSLLTLTSHHIGHESTNSLIFHHSKPIARLIPAPSHEVLRSASHGTSVTVNDLFGNMPVRVKSRAIALQKPGELDREWDNLRNSLLSLLLANPQISKLVLIDAEKGKQISIRPTPSTPANHLDGKSPFDIGRIGSILAQSGLISPRDWAHWHEISASVPGLTVRAAISLQASPTQKMQFISLGNEPVLSRNGSNILYNEMNRLFSLSDFGNLNSIPGHASSHDRSNSIIQNDVQSNASTKSWAKPINKWPMFYVRLDTRVVLRFGDEAGQTRFPESDKSLERIVDVLGVMVREFLKQHYMRPRSGKRQDLSSTRPQSLCSRDLCSDQAPGNDLQTARLVSSADEAFSGHIKLPSLSRPQLVSRGQNFSNWTRVKAAQIPEAWSPIQRNHRSGGDTGVMRDRRTLSSHNGLAPDSSGHSLGSKEHSEALKPSHPGEGDNGTADQSEDVSQDKMITWVDPHTKLAYLINPRTGQTMNSRKSLATQRAQLYDPEEVSGDPARGLWVEGLLETWENPSFRRTEVPISNLGGDPMAQNTLNTSHNCFKGIGSLETAHIAKYRGKIHRLGLQTADVIAQVDKKFILAKVSTDTTKASAGGESHDLLLLIDQHAADERCRLEQLFEEMFLPSSGTLGPDDGVRTVEVFIDFEVSETEGCLFKKYTTLFTAWGIHYDTQMKSKSTALITVRTLPVLIAERCRVEPHVLIELMRREIWSHEEHGKLPPQSKKVLECEYGDEVLGLSDNADPNHKQVAIPSTSSSWVRKMNRCPQGIIDLLNSRACRTAIMFNDPLSIEECQALVSRLARCAFPFQCAHGRPSMVPILDLRSLPNTHVPLPLNVDTSEFPDEEADLDYMEAFRAHYPT